MNGAFLLYPWGGGNSRMLHSSSIHSLSPTNSAIPSDTFVLSESGACSAAEHHPRARSKPLMTRYPATPPIIAGTATYPAHDREMPSAQTSPAVAINAVTAAPSPEAVNTPVVPVAAMRGQTPAEQL